MDAQNMDSKRIFWVSFAALLLAGALLLAIDRAGTSTTGGRYGVTI